MHRYSGAFSISHEKLVLALGEVVVALGVTAALRICPLAVSEKGESQQCRHVAAESLSWFQVKLKEALRKAGARIDGWKDPGRLRNHKA